MNTNVHELLDNALRLDRSERADLAASLIESLEAAQDADSEAEWRDEVRRRCQSLDAGAAQAVPWEDARARILAR
jgi:putative addiction module component (TIGR02574 family)